MKGISVRQRKNEEKNMEMAKDHERFASAGGFVFDSALNVQKGKDVRLYNMKKLILSWYQNFTAKSNHFFKQAVLIQPAAADALRLCASHLPVLHLFMPDWAF